MTTATNQLLLTRPPETDDELYYLVQALWGTRIPRTPVCPEHIPPFVAFADAYFGRNSVDPDSPVQSIALWHGSRGLSGKSFMLSILGLTKSFMLGNDTNLLGGSLAQSVNIHEHMRSAMEYRNAPQYMIADNTGTRVKLTNGARIRPLTASQRTVRGPHPALLLCDEIDEMDLPILDAALGQPMPQKNYLDQIIEPYTVMCSTWQNPDGTFAEIYKRADEQRIPKYAWCYKETSNPVDGWLSEKAIAEKKALIPAEMWRTEYDLGEPSIGNRAFDPDSVDATFCLPFEPIKKKVQKDYEEYQFAEYERDGQYVIGADWAKEQDYTVIVVLRIDREPYEMVYYARLNRRPYSVMIPMFNEAMEKYNAQGEYDRTGLGNVINDYIDVRAHGFMMVGDKRNAMLSEFVNGVEKPGTLAFPRIPTAYLATKYCQVGDLYASAASTTHHLPDEVCAMALAYYRALRSVPAAGIISIGKTSEPNRYQKIFELREGEVTNNSLTGDVRLVDETTSFSLL